MLDVLTKEMSLVKVTIKDKENEISCAKTSIINLVNAKEALESSISGLTIQNQQLQVQLEKCENSTTSPFVIDSNASSSKTSTCKH
jgi:septal ring factor EnvC (AmiA/AmiB activator)